MFPVLIAQPIKREPAINHPPPKRMVRQLDTRSTVTAEGVEDEEESHVLKLIAWSFALMVVPAVLTFLYLTMNPEAFLTDVTSHFDFSTWQTGQRP